MNANKPSLITQNLTCSDAKFQDVLSDYFNISQTDLIPFSCKHNLIFALLSNLDSKKLYLFSPLELDYENYAKKLNFTITHINRFIEDEISFIENSIVILSNPSQPDGTFYDLDKFLNESKSKNITLIIDESYINFTNKNSAKQLLHSFKNIYIIHDLKPFFANLIQSSILISNPNNITHLQKNITPCTISNEEKTNLLEILEDKSFKKVSNTLNLVTKEEFIKECEKLPYIQKVFPSSTNYCLVLLKNITYNEIYNKLGNYQEYITSGEQFYPLDDSYIKIILPKFSKLQDLLAILKSIH